MYENPGRDPCPPYRRPCQHLNFILSSQNKLLKIFLVTHRIHMIKQRHE